MSKPSSYTSPFFHRVIPNFLPSKDYEKLMQIYSKLQFKEKSSDLFHFFQTNELASDKSLEFFRKNLSKQYQKLCTPQQFKKSFYSIFASYYFEGDYLLCHDDIVEDRKYAFSYYLEDFQYGGELVLFNGQANQQKKKIKVKKNTLAIFQVCDVSYHEVAYCYGTGRKAVTGWFNIKGQGQKRIPKPISSFKPNHIKNALSYPLEEAYIQQEYFQMMNIQYQFNIIKETVEGPFFSRKLHRVEIDPAVIFQLPGYELFSSDFYKVKQGDYLLLNDPINLLQGQDIIDIIVTSLPESYQTEDENVLIKIIEEDGSLSGIPEIDDSLFVIRRCKKQFYIERNSQEFMFAHFIYREQKKANKSQQVKKVPVKKQIKSKKTAQKKSSATPKPRSKTQKSEGASVQKGGKLKQTKKIVKPQRKSHRKI